MSSDFCRVFEFETLIIKTINTMTQNQAMTLLVILKSQLDIETTRSKRFIESLHPHPSESNKQNIEYLIMDSTLNVIEEIKRQINIIENLKWA